MFQDVQIGSKGRIFVRGSSDVPFEMLDFVPSKLYVSELYVWNGVDGSCFERKK